jgi:hypothetical protein
MFVSSKFVDAVLDEFTAVLNDCPKLLNIGYKKFFIVYCELIDITAVMQERVWMGGMFAT